MKLHIDNMLHGTEQLGVNHRNVLCTSIHKFFTTIFYYINCLHVETKIKSCTSSLLSLKYITCYC